MPYCVGEMQSSFILKQVVIRMVTALSVTVSLRTKFSDAYSDSILFSWGATEGNFVHNYRYKSEKS
jgi:hypothetical protein